MRDPSSEYRRCVRTATGAGRVERSINDQGFEAAWVLGLLIVAGGIGGFIVAAIVWRSPIAGWSPTGLAAMSLMAMWFGAGVVLAARRLPQAALECIAAVAGMYATLTVIRYARAPNAGFVLLLWPVLWSFTYLPIARAVAQTGVASASLVALFALQDGWKQPGVYIVFVVFTFVATALVVSRLVQRSEAHAARERDANRQLAALNATLADQVEKQVNEITSLGRLRRFLSPQVAEVLLSTDGDGILAPHRREIAVVFCDLRGFTSLAAAAEPEDVTSILTDYHSVVGALVDRHEATVGGFAGDGVLLYFNDPIPCDNPAERAVRLAMDLSAPMNDVERKWRQRGFSIGFGVGIAFGYATLGMTGFESRSDYTALGTVVNLASRLSDEAQPSEILLDLRAKVAVEDNIAVETAGERTLKGFDRPVLVYRVVAT